MTPEQLRKMERSVVRKAVLKRFRPGQAVAWNGYEGIVEKNGDIRVTKMPGLVHRASLNTRSFDGNEVRGWFPDPAVVKSELAKVRGEKS